MQGLVDCCEMLFFSFVDSFNVPDLCMMAITVFFSYCLSSNSKCDFALFLPFCANYFTILLLTVSILLLSVFFIFFLEMHFCCWLVSGTKLAFIAVFLMISFVCLCFHSLSHFPIFFLCFLQAISVTYTTQREFP